MSGECPADEEVQSLPKEGSIQRNNFLKGVKSFQLNGKGIENE